MEALFESINVQDLLSASDLSDPTTPLSAPDLRLLIQRLDSHSLRIKSRIQAYLSAHAEEFTNLFTLCNETVLKSDRISEALDELLTAVSDRPIDAEIAGIAAEMSANMRELRAKRELLALVRIVVEISEKIGGVREGMRSGRLIFAAEGLRDLKKAIGVDGGGSAGADEREPVVYGLLRKEWFDCFDEVTEFLSLFCVFLYVDWKLDLSAPFLYYYLRFLIVCF